MTVEVAKIVNNRGDVVKAIDTSNITDNSAITIGDDNHEVQLSNKGGSTAAISADATGSKQLTADPGGDRLINQSTSANVTMSGGAGADTNAVSLKNTMDGGALIDQMAASDVKTTNNITGYNPLLNFFRMAAEAISNVRARFVNGQLVTRNGLTTNNFLSSGRRDLAALSSTDVDSVFVEDNVIYGGSSNNSLWGGESSDDALFGGDGRNEFYYSQGNGDYVISMQDGGSRQEDVQSEVTIFE